MSSMLAFDILEEPQPVPPVPGVHTRWAFVGGHFRKSSGAIHPQLFPELRAAGTWFQGGDRRDPRSVGSWHYPLQALLVLIDHGYLLRIRGQEVQSADTLMALF